MIWKPIDQPTKGVIGKLYLNDDFSYFVLNGLFFYIQQSAKFRENYISSLQKKRMKWLAHLKTYWVHFKHGRKNIFSCCPNIPTSLHQMKKLFKQIKTTLVSKLNQGTTSWDILIDSSFFQVFDNPTDPNHCFEITDPHLHEETYSED